MKLNLDHLCSIPTTGMGLAGIILMIGQFTDNSFIIGSTLTGSSILIGITYSCARSLIRFKSIEAEEKDKLLDK